MTDTLLIVDDEDSVRLTFAEWLQTSFPQARVLQAADAAAALRAAKEHPVDLALLDWNLGAGQNGLQLLEDLLVFRPDLVAILVTGYAQQATPLDALRMGIRDYLDKSLELKRETLTAAVDRQLRWLRPHRRERSLNAQLAAFRSAVEEALACIKATAPIACSEGLRQVVKVLLGCLKELTGATAGQLVWRRYQEDQQPPEQRRRYLDHGEMLEESDPPFPTTLAGAAGIHVGTSHIVNLRQAQEEWNLKLPPAKARFHEVLLLPLRFGTQISVVIELFDRATGHFGPPEQQILNHLAPILELVLGYATGQEESRNLLLQALEAALVTSQTAADPDASSRLQESLRKSLDSSLFQDIGGAEVVAASHRLQELARKHGTEALRRSLSILDEIQKLLDAQAGLEESA